jgi:hypothetical protein
MMHGQQIIKHNQATSLQQTIKREVRGSNLGRDTGYSEVLHGFSRSSQAIIVIVP